MPDTPLAKYISMRDSSTPLSLRQYRSIIVISKEIPLGLGTLKVSSLEMAEGLQL